MKQVKFGSKKEQKVAQALRSKGAKVLRNLDSKGASDLSAKFPTGTKWNVQVKATRKGSSARPSSRDLGRLKQSARRSGATAVIARVSPKGIDYESAIGRKLNPPKRKR